MHNAPFQAVVFGLAASTAWGVADFCGAKVSKELGGYQTAFLVSVFATLSYCIIFLVFLRSYAHLSGMAFLYAAAAGVIFTLAMASFYRGLELGPVSIVSPLGSLYPLVTTVLLVALFGNHLRMRQELGVGVVVTGVLAASGLFERVKSNQRLSTGPLLGLLAALCWGTNFALLTQAIDRIGWQSATLIQQSFSTLAFLVVLPLLLRQRSPLSVQPSHLHNSDCRHRPCRSFSFDCGRSFGLLPRYHRFSSAEKPW